VKFFTTAKWAIHLLFYLKAGAIAEINDRLKQIVNPLRLGPCSMERKTHLPFDLFDVRWEALALG
jgi:hypothetical protein